MSSPEQDEYENAQEKMTHNSPKSGTIIGLAFRVPGASDIKDLFTLLHSDQPVNHHINEAATIDIGFFNMLPEEAYQSSPVLGMLLEVVAECIMESGIPFKEITKKRTGLYLQSNLANTYMDLTSKVSHYFNLTGPVIDFSRLDDSPSKVIHAALLDLITGSCDLAIIVGICGPGPSLLTKDTNTYSHLEQNQITEGIAAFLIKSPKATATPSNRVFCDIVLHDDENQPDWVFAKDSVVPNHKTGENEQSKYELFELLQEAKDGNEVKITKISCSDMAKRIFQSSHPISALMALMSCISYMVCEKNDKAKARLQRDDQVTSVLFHDLQQHQLVLKRQAVTSSEDKAPLAAVIPTTVHPLSSVEKAEEILGKYENHPGFLQFLANSELSQGLKGPLQQLHYYFKIPGSSQYSRQDFTAYGEMLIVVAFDDFLLSPWKPSADILNLPVVEKSVTLFDEILKKENVQFSVLKSLRSGCIPEPWVDGGLLTRVACQMAMVDLLTVVHSCDDIYTIEATGVGSLAASYADGALSRIQVVLAAHAIEKHLCSAKEEKLILDVYCPTDDVYQLGPWVQVLCHLCQGGFRIAAPIEKRTNVIELIVRKGFVYKEHSIQLPVFSHAFRDSLDVLGTRLNNIIPISTWWSARAKIIGLIDKGKDPRKCDSGFFLDMLCSPFDSKLESRLLAGVVRGSHRDEANSGNVDKMKIDRRIGEETPAQDFKEMPETKNRLMEMVRSNDNFSSTPLNIDNFSKLFMDCSTNAIKGSFLCPSVTTESSSSISQSPSDEDQSNASNKYAATSTTRYVYQPADKENDTSNVSFIHLHFFGSDAVQRADNSNSEEEDTYVSTSSKEVIDESVHLYMEASQGGLLETLAWINGTGNCMEAEHQFCKGLTQDSHYRGDFVINSLWAWNKDTCCGSETMQDHDFGKYKEDIAMYSLSPKPQLKVATLQELIDSRSLSNLQTDSIDQMTSHNQRNFPCAFDSSLLILSGFGWDPVQSEVLPNSSSAVCSSDDLRMIKQVRFSYSSGFVGDFMNNEEEMLRFTVNEECNFTHPDDLNYGFVNTGDLLVALNQIRRNEFNFVSLLQIDQSMEQHLTDILVSFPITSSLHIFITPKLSATSVSKYVINMSRKTSGFPNGDDVSVLLRDRSTDGVERCPSVTGALSIISSFEGEIFPEFLARVFEFPMFLGDETVSFTQLEFMIFDVEREVSKEICLELGSSANSISSSSSSTTSNSFELHDIMDNSQDISDLNGNFASKDGINGENFSCGSSQQECTSRNTNSICESMKTSFNLNLDETFVKTLNKLTKVNKHTIGYIYPKDHKGFLNGKVKNETFTITNGTETCQSNKFTLGNDEASPQFKGKPKCFMQPIYMMSVKELRKPQIFLYYKKNSNAVISQWESMREVYEELTEQHPAIQQSHEVFVSKFNDEEDSFEQLLYCFMHDVVNPVMISHINEITDKMENEVHNSQCNEHCMNIKNADLEPEQENDAKCMQDCKHSHYDSECVKQMNGSACDYKEQEISEEAASPNNLRNKFVIPEIVISPPPPYVSRNVCRENGSKLVEHGTIFHKELTSSACCTQICTQPVIQEKNYKKTHSTMNNDCIENSRESISSSNKAVTIATSQMSVVGEETENVTRTPKPRIDETRISTPKNKNHQMIKHDNESELNTDSPTNHDSPLLNTTGSLTCSDSYQEGESSNYSGSTVFGTPTTSKSEKSEDKNNSDKENTTMFLHNESDEALESLKRPRFEEMASMKKHKVTSYLVVHLTDRISSIQEQKGRAAGNLLLYIAKEIVDNEEEEEDRDVCLGMVLFDDTDVRHSRFPIPSATEDSQLETVLNYLLAWYIIRILAKVNRSNAARTNTFIQAPIQRDSASIMIVAGHFGCNKVVASSSVEEIREDLHRMVPRVQLLDGQFNKFNVLSTVGKNGADAIVMLRQQELREHLDLMAPSGRLVLCGDIDRTMEIDLSTVAKNGQITTFDALTAFRYFTMVEGEAQKEFKEELFNLVNTDKSRLNDCFPSAREGYFYQIIGCRVASCPDEQPMESDIYDIFFSTTSTVPQVLQFISSRQKKMMYEIYQSLIRSGGEGSM